MTPATAAFAFKLLEVLLLGLTLTPDVLAGFRRKKTLLERMVAEGRDPTPEESAELDGEIESLRAGFHKPIAPAGA